MYYPDPDPNWAKILDPDPNSMYLDPQHWLQCEREYLEFIIFIIFHLRCNQNPGRTFTPALIRSKCPFTSQLRNTTLRLKSFAPFQPALSTSCAPRGWRSAVRHMWTTSKFSAWFGAWKVKGGNTVKPNHLSSSGLGIRSFQKNGMIFAIFSVLYKRTERSLRCFLFFIKERNDL